MIKEPAMAYRRSYKFLGPFVEVNWSHLLVSRGLYDQEPVIYAAFALASKERDEMASNILGWDHGALAPETSLEFRGMFEEWKFFLPSEKVTNNILSLNRKFGDDYSARRDAKLIKREGLKLETDFKVRDDNWLQTVSDQVSEILFHEGGETKEPMSPKDAIGFFPKFVSERIYNHLAMLARSPHAKEEGTFSIREELTAEIAGRIGLGLYLSSRTPDWLRKETEEGLNDLAYEFQYWLVKIRQGFYPTTWGVVCSPEKAKEVAEQGVYAQPLIMEPDVEKKVKTTAAPAAAHTVTG